MCIPQTLPPLEGSGKDVGYNGCQDILGEAIKREIISKSLSRQALAHTVSLCGVDTARNDEQCTKCSTGRSSLKKVEFHRRKWHFHVFWDFKAGLAAI